MTSTGGTKATVQNMEVSSLCNSQSDLQCLELVTGAHAAATICLTTIGHNVACYTRLLAAEFDRATRCRAHSLWLCQPSYLVKTVFATFKNSATGSHDTLGAVAVGFGKVQPGFLQLLLTQTWVKCTSLDSSRCVVYSGDSSCK